MNDTEPENGDLSSANSGTAAASAAEATPASATDATAPPVSTAGAADPSASGDAPDTTATPTSAVGATEATTATVADAAKTAPPTSANEYTDGSAPDEYVCSLYILCDRILANIDRLNPEKLELVPADGLIYHSDAVEFSDGENVFDILQRETRRERIHFEYVSTPFFGSEYIKGVNNLYEFDCGELSGWTYRVNGAVPGYGCSLYILSPGDIVEILYTCDLGQDIGGDVGQ